MDAIEVGKLDELKGLIEDVDLKLPENIRKRACTFSGASPLGAQTNYVLCDVTGSGKLFYAVSSFQAGSHIGTVKITLKITIDDVVVTIQTGDNNTSGCCIGYYSDEAVFIRETSGSRTTIMLEDFYVVGSGEGPYRNVYLNSVVSAKTLYGGNSAISETDKFMRTAYGLNFNQKLKVELTTNVLSSSYPNRMDFPSGVYYYLDEE